MTEAQHIPVVQQLAAIQVALQLFKDQIPQPEWDSTSLPIIAAPKAWLEAVRDFAGGAEDELPLTIYNCQVVQQDNIDEPVLIRHDGKTYKVSSFVEKITIAGESAVVVPDAAKLN